MLISSSDLINLPVFTASEDYLGKISSWDIDIDTNAITHYYVRTGTIKGLWHQQLMINVSQVISISKEKMVVDDDTVKNKETNLGPAPLPYPAK